MGEVRNGSASICRQEGVTDNEERLFDCEDCGEVVEADWIFGICQGCGQRICKGCIDTEAHAHWADEHEDDWSCVSLGGDPCGDCPDCRSSGSKRAAAILKFFWNSQTPIDGPGGG